MNIFKAYTNGFRLSVRFPAMILIVYLVNLFLGIMLAIPFHKVMHETVGDSVAVKTMIQQFDYTVFSDFMNTAKMAIKAINSQIVIFGIFYFLLSIFLTGGILRTFNRQKFTMSSFFAGCGQNFMRFTGLNIWMLLFHIVIAIIIYIPTIIIFQNAYDVVSSEKQLFYIFITAVCIHSVFFILLLIISDYAKFYMLLNDSNSILKSFVQAIKYVFSNFLKTYGLFLFLLLVPAAIFYFYFSVEDDIGMITLKGIIFVFIIQQLFIIIRIWMKIWILGSQNEIYSASFIQPDKIENEKSRREDWQDNAKVAEAAMFEAQRKKDLAEAQNKELLLETQMLQEEIKKLNDPELAETARLLEEDLNSSSNIIN